MYVCLFDAKNIKVAILFQNLFSSVTPGQHPIIILKDVSYEDLDSVVQFMYNGIVNVSSDKLPAVLKVHLNCIVLYFNVDCRLIFLVDKVDLVFRYDELD